MYPAQNANKYERDTFHVQLSMKNILHLGAHNANTPICNILQYFTAVTMIFFLWNEAVLTSTHDLCFRAKIRKKNVYPSFTI